jgi:outer membrane protein assembly factor BamE
MIAFNLASDRMLKLTKLLILSLAAVAMAGCAFFRVEIQQGNYITQEQVEQLEPGMTMREVRYIMGTPLVVDPFHEKHRWDYVYAYSPDLGTDFEKRRITLFFENDTLEQITGDVQGTELAEAYEGSGGTRVTSPTEASEKGFFGRTMDKILRRGD